MAIESSSDRNRIETLNLRGQLTLCAEESENAPQQKVAYQRSE